MPFDCPSSDLIDRHFVAEPRAIRAIAGGSGRGGTAMMRASGSSNDGSGRGGRSGDVRGAPRSSRLGRDAIDAAGSLHLAGVGGGRCYGRSSHNSDGPVYGAALCPLVRAYAAAISREDFPTPAAPRTNSLIHPRTVVVSQPLLMPRMCWLKRPTDTTTWGERRRLLRYCT